MRKRLKKKLIKHKAKVVSQAIRNGLKMYVGEVRPGVSDQRILEFWERHKKWE